MKKLLLLVGLVVFLAPLVQAGEYDGKWKDISIMEEKYGKNQCMPLSWKRFSNPLIISNNKATMEIGALFGKFIGKVKKNKIYMHNNHGQINGKFKDNKLEISFKCQTKVCQMVYGDCDPFEFEKISKKLNIKLETNTDTPVLYPSDNSKSNNSDSLEERLNKLKSLYDKELITKEEYDQKREELLGKSSTIEIEDNQTIDATSDKNSLKEQLIYWKDLYDEELISKEEYDEKRKELLSGTSTIEIEDSVDTIVIEDSAESKKGKEKILKDELDQNICDEDWVYTKSQSHGEWCTEEDGKGKCIIKRRYSLRGDFDLKSLKEMCKLEGVITYRDVCEENYDNRQYEKYGRINNGACASLGRKLETLGSGCKRVRGKDFELSDCWVIKEQFLVKGKRITNYQKLGIRYGCGIESKDLDGCIKRQLSSMKKSTCLAIMKSFKQKAKKICEN